MASLGGRAIKMSPPERVCGHFVNFLDELRGGNQSWTGANLTKKDMFVVSLDTLPE